MANLPTHRAKLEICKLLSSRRAHFARLSGVRHAAKDIASDSLLGSWLAVSVQTASQNIRELTRGLDSVFGLAVFQRKLQYFPDCRLTDLAQTDLSGGEELRLRTGDGETLVAWYFRPKGGRPLILYFHGNGGALVDRVSRFHMFTARGYGLLAVSYRGYGGSTGSPTEGGLMQDGEAACRAARARP